VNSPFLFSLLENIKKIILEELLVFNINLEQIIEVLFLMYQEIFMGYCKF